MTSLVRATCPAAPSPGAARTETDPPMPLHPYERSPHSNAGNCVCGMDYESRIHPHPYTKSYSDDLCVCAYPADHPIHTSSEDVQR